MISPPFSYRYAIQQKQESTRATLLHACFLRRAPFAANTRWGACIDVPPRAAHLGSGRGEVRAECLPRVVIDLTDRPGTSPKGSCDDLLFAARPAVISGSHLLGATDATLGSFLRLGGGCFGCFLRNLLAGLLGALATVRFFATFGAFFAGALRAVLVFVFFAAIFSCLPENPQGGEPPERVCCKTYIATYCDVSTKKFIAILELASTNLGPRRHYCISPSFFSIRPNGLFLKKSTDRAFPLLRATP